ncbi:MAG TPA: helix-turn-helix domain-containing protein [Leptolyngbyaceae cyanobacterium]
MARQFEQVANFVTERIAELLCAQVLVVDERGVAIAQSTPFAQEENFPQWCRGTDLQECNLKSKIQNPKSEIQNPKSKIDLRVPIHCNGRSGEVVIAASEQGETISARLAQMLVEMLVNQTAVIAQLPTQNELKNKFIHDLLCGSTLAEADILRQGQLLGMDFTRPRAVILIDAADYILEPKQIVSIDAETWIWQRAQSAINSVVRFFHLPNDTICAYIGDGEVAVLKASSTQDLIAWAERENSPSQSNPSWANLKALKRAGAALLTRLRCATKATISIGIGRYHPGIQGLAQSYQDARAALRLGRRFHGTNQVHCLDELGIAAFVGIADESTKIDLAKHLLSPLDREKDLFATLDTFFKENCCPSKSASRLSIHRNTLSYRLDKITWLTGLDPRRFDEAMQIRLALLLRCL